MIIASSLVTSASGLKVESGYPLIIFQLFAITIAAKCGFSLSISVNIDSVEVSDLYIPRLRVRYSTSSARVIGLSGQSFWSGNQRDVIFSTVA